MWYRRTFETRNKCRTAGYPRIQFAPLPCGRRMTGSCAKRPSRIAGQSGHIRRALEQALG